MQSRFNNYPAVIIRSCKEVFKEWRYSIVAGGAFLAILFLELWLPNAVWLRDLLASPAFTIAAKARLLLLSFFRLDISFGAGSPIITLLLPAFFGVNMSLLVYYFRKKAGSGTFAGFSVAGIVVGMLGVGCAACGSVLFSAILGFSAAAGFLGFLPFGGREFAFLSLLLMGISIVLLAKKLQEADACSIK